MHIRDTRSYRDEEGWPVDKVDLDGSEYEEIVRRQLSDDRIVLKGIRKDGSEDSFVFDRLPERYIGLEPLDEDRRDIPEDVQDVAMHLGYAIKPKFENE